MILDELIVKLESIKSELGTGDVELLVASDPEGNRFSTLDQLSEEAAGRLVLWPAGDTIDLDEESEEDEEDAEESEEDEEFDDTEE